MTNLLPVLIGFMLGVITSSAIFCIQFSRLRNEINELNTLLYETQKELERAKNMPELDTDQLSFSSYMDNCGASELVEDD